MIRLLKFCNIAKGSFGHHVLVMFIGTALGQMTSVLLSPFLTRLYTPQEFGLFGTFTALVTILSVIANLRYEMALPLAQSDGDALHLLAVCAAALACTTTASLLLVACLPSTLFGALAPYRWLLPAGFFAIGAYQIMAYYATRHAAFSGIARTKIYQGLSGPLTQIALGLAGFSVWGLICGFIVGQSSGVGLLIRRLLFHPNMPRAPLHWQRACALARRFKRFPLVSSWSGIINSAGSTYVLLVAMPIFYSSAIAGFVFLTDRVIGRPLLIISTSIMQVYMGDAGKARTANPHAMRARFLQLAGRQALVVSAWLALANLAAPYVFAPLFGQEWLAAVPYLHVLSIAYLPQMVMHSLTHTLQILERQALSAVWEISRLAAVVGALAAGHAFGLDALHALLFYSIAQALAQLVLFALCYHSLSSLKGPSNAHAI